MRIKLPSDYFISLSNPGNQSSLSTHGADLQIRSLPQHGYFLTYGIANIRALLPFGNKQLRTDNHNSRSLSATMGALFNRLHHAYE